jgi:death-on-curing protein
LDRPQQLYAYGEAPDIIDMAALYTAGIVRNHPFVDGNKPAGFVVGVLFLELNGYRLSLMRKIPLKPFSNLLPELSMKELSRVGCEPM